jgi:hypothetical protein
VSLVIDNATISSVQRALGIVSIKEPSLLDIEHVALGRFCEAVLFHEEITIPDNYKAEMSESRKRLLNHEIFHFDPVSAEEDTQMIEIARDLSEVWVEAFRFGSDRSLFSKYFQQVQAFSHFLWEHSTSDFFLVFRALGIDKENPLIEAVLASQANIELGQKLKIIGADDVPVAWRKLSPHVQRMLSVLAWLGHQYIWYQVYCASRERTYLPHPLRDFFSHDFLTRINRGASSGADFSAAFSQGIDRFVGKMADALVELGQRRESVTLNLHSLLPLLIRESSSGKDFIPVLMQIREENDVVSLRQMLAHVQTSIDKGDFTPAQKLKADIDKVGKNILAERGIEQRLVNITPSTTLVGISVSGGDLSLQKRIPPVLYKQFFVGRTYRAFVKRVMEELAIPSQYGALKTKLNNYAWISGDRFPKFYLKEDRSPSKYNKTFRTSELKE